MQCNILQAWKKLWVHSNKSKQNYTIIAIAIIIIIIIIVIIAFLSSLSLLLSFLRHELAWMKQLIPEQLQLLERVLGHFFNLCKCHTPFFLDFFSFIHLWSSLFLYQFFLYNLTRSRRNTFTSNCFVKMSDCDQGFCGSILMTVKYVVWLTRIQISSILH